jgi:NitT/TauT family transport system substrate-binding protein
MQPTADILIAVEATACGPQRRQADRVHRSGLGAHARGEEPQSGYIAAPRRRRSLAARVKHLWRALAGWPGEAPHPSRPAKDLPMKSPVPRVLALAFAALGVCTAQAQEKLSFLTNWYAQAEHGGFYQALATGLYKKEGLDVSLKMGGPQVNGLQLLAAGQTDCVMGYDVQIAKAREQGIHAVTVAAAFQKDPLVMIGHPATLKTMQDLKGKTILISADAHTNYWPWMRSTFGLSDAQVRPYTFNIQPFVADRNAVQQGYLSSEPYAIEREAKFKPSVFLLSDYGWPPYSTTIVCMEDTLKKTPKAVAAFVKASMQGWKDYLKGDPAAANALIKKDNPNMTDDRIAVGIKLMNETGMVDGGDAARMGIGIITDERMKKTYDMMVAMKLVDPSKVDLKKTYTTEFVKDLKIMP